MRVSTSVSRSRCASLSSLAARTSATTSLRRETASGNELLAVTGRIVNPSKAQQTVRDIRAELRDAQGRTVYSWTITRPVPQLAPGGAADFDSAAVDIPRGAKNLHLSFIGPTGN